MKALCARRGLAHYTHPERLETVEELPMSKFGKVAKHELTRLAEERGGAVRS